MDGSCRARNSGNIGRMTILVLVDMYNVRTTMGPGGREGKLGSLTTAWPVRIGPLGLVVQVKLSLGSFLEISFNPAQTGRLAVSRWLLVNQNAPISLKTGDA